MAEDLLVSEFSLCKLVQTLLSVMKYNRGENGAEADDVILITCWKRKTIVFELIPFQSVLLFNFWTEL